MIIETGPSTPSPGSGDSVRGVIAERVHRLEALLGSPTRDPSPPKNLWFYKVIETNMMIFYIKHCWCFLERILSKERVLVCTNEEYKHHKEYRLRSRNNC